MGLKFSESYEILVLPKNSPNMRKYVVKGSTIRALIYTVVGIVLVLIVAAAGTWLYIRSQPNVAQVRALEQENLELKKQLSRISQKIALFEQTLSNIENFEAQLRRLTQIHDPKRQLAMGPVSEQDFIASLSGNSATGKFNEALLLKLEETLNTTDPEELASRLDELLKGAQDSELKLAELTAYVREQKFVLSHIPSIRPTKGWLTSGFGMRINPFTHTQQFHEGIDIANAVGTPIVAPADGTIAFVGEKDGYGKTVIIDHGFGIQTLYGHLAEIWVAVGDSVKRGQVFATMGNTGRSTGPHLHYEVRVHGIPRNPLYYIIE